jgi:hypothetical protein
MARTLLIWCLCLALMALGASGLHGHLPHRGDHGDQESWHAAHVVTVFNDDHLNTHDKGDIDIDPVTKAFGKGPVIQIVAALLAAWGIVWFLHAVRWQIQAVLPPPRPPKVRYRPYLLPPSQAPPCAV